MAGRPRQFGLLDSVEARFQQQQEERQRRVEKLQARREAEVAHSLYLKQNVVDHSQMAEARFTVGQWAKKHGGAVERQIKEAVGHSGSKRSPKTVRKSQTFKTNNDTQRRTSGSRNTPTSGLSSTSTSGSRNTPTSGLSSTSTSGSRNTPTSGLSSTSTSGSRNTPSSGLSSTSTSGSRNTPTSGLSSTSTSGSRNTPTSGLSSTSTSGSRNTPTSGLSSTSTSGSRNTPTSGLSSTRFSSLSPGPSRVTSVSHRPNRDMSVSSVSAEGKLSRNRSSVPGYSPKKTGSNSSIIDLDSPIAGVSNSHVKRSDSDMGTGCELFSVSYMDIQESGSNDPCVQYSDMDVYESGSNSPHAVQCPGSESTRDASVISVNSSDGEDGPVAAILLGTKCCILNCEADFSSKEGILKHEASFSHSPCNPFLMVRDLVFPDTPIAYCCPKCFKVFMTKEGCRQHQTDLSLSTAKHLQFLSPLAVAGYLCPQCLSAFISHKKCHDHMLLLKHHSTTYPFQGDMDHQVGTHPIPVSRRLMDDFLCKCSAVSFTVSCIDCTLILTSNAELVQHLKETDHLHCHFNARASSTQVDVFSGYLKSHACSRCDSVMSLTDHHGDLHYCVRTGKGHIEELNCHTFKDFVRRCCVSMEMRQYASSSNGSHGGKRKRSSDVDDGGTLSTESGGQTEACTKLCGKKNKTGDNIVAQLLMNSINGKRSVELARNSDQMEARTELDGKKNKTGDNIVTQLLMNSVNGKRSVELAKNSDQLEARTELDGKKKKTGDNIITHVQLSVNSVNGKRCVELAKNTDQIIAGSSGQGSSASPAATETVHVDRSLPLKQHRNVTSLDIVDERLIDPIFLNTMCNLIFLDIDNWSSFFQKLPCALPNRTFVWGFYGGTQVWKEPQSCPAYDHQVKTGGFYLNSKCGRTKDAADFAICLTFGRMDERLDKHVAFTVLSGDHGFHELERQMENKERRIVVIDPHDIQRMAEPRALYTYICSVIDH